MNLGEITSSHLDSDKFYFLLPCGIGDAFVVSNLLEQIQSKLGSKVVLIVPDNLQVILKMNGIEDCLAFEARSFYYCKGAWNNLLYDLGKKNPIPKLGQIFVCQPMYVLEKQKQDDLYLGRTIVSWYVKFLGLDETVQFDWTKVRYPMLRDDIREQIEMETGHEISKLHLFLPEALSISCLNPSFWKELFISLTKCGVAESQIIQNRNIARLDFIKAFSLPLDQTIALAMGCQKVYSLRSGICDAISAKDKDLMVFYTNQVSKDTYSLNASYGLNEVKEIQL